MCSLLIQGCEGCRGGTGFRRHGCCSYSCAVCRGCVLGTPALNRGRIVPAAGPGRPLSSKFTRVVPSPSGLMAIV